jgi:GNAT superfamily N-acetyltransferase
VIGECHQLIQINMPPGRFADSHGATFRSRVMTTSDRTITPSNTPAGKLPTKPAARVPHPTEPHWHDVLLDGTAVFIRPIHKPDAALEREFIEHLSARSKRLRFLGAIGTPSDTLVRQLTDFDDRREAAFAALLARDGEKHFIGASRFALGADRKSCECAITVADEWQHKGLGTLLMRHLIDVARERGVREMVSLDAAENPEMRELAEYLGFSREADPLDATQVIHRLKL